MILHRCLSHFTTQKMVTRSRESTNFKNITSRFGLVDETKREQSRSRAKPNLINQILIKLNMLRMNIEYNNYIERKNYG